MKSRETLKVSWLTAIGKQKFESINPFWVACHKKSVRPEICYLLHTPELIGIAKNVKGVGRVWYRASLTE